MRYSDHHQEEAQKRRELRRQREQPEVERDFTKTGFWAWLAASEARFLYGLIWMGFAGITAVLLLVMLFATPTSVIDPASYVVLTAVIAIVAVALTIPLLISYAKFRHQSMRQHD